MNEFSKSAMIALLPNSAEWCRIELPHLTLVYAGEIEGRPLSEYNYLAKEAASLALGFRPFSLTVMEYAVFGDDDRVDVLKLRANPELLAMRNLVERWNHSEYDFNPHCTVGPTGSVRPPMPAHIYFNRIMVCWGNAKMTFNMS